MKVVVTREMGHNETVADLAPDGATVVEVPLTTTRFFDFDEVRTAVEASEYFGSYRALVVSSARSSRYVSLAKEALGKARAS